MSTAGNNAIRWQLCSAAPDVLEKVVNYFYDRYKIEKPSILTQPRKAPIYYIQYSSVPTRQIYHALYYKEDLLYLPRKKEKFEQIYSKNLKK